MQSADGRIRPAIERRLGDIACRPEHRQRQQSCRHAHLGLQRCRLQSRGRACIEPRAGSGNLPIASVPYDYTQTNYKLVGDYRIGKASNLIGTFERENYERDHRERERTWEDKYKLEYANRDFENSTLRASYEYAQRRGSEYISNPITDYTSYSLGPLPTANGTNAATWIRTIASLRKYDLADRDSNILNARFNTSPLQDFDVGLAAQWKDLQYPNSDYGRTDHDQRGSVSLDLNYQPSAWLSVYGYYAYQTGKMQQAGIQNASCVIGQNGITADNFLSICGAAGGPLYPLANVWNVNSKDRNNVVGTRLALGYGQGAARFQLHVLARPHEDQLRLRKRDRARPDAGGACRHRLLRSHVRAEHFRIECRGANQQDLLDPLLLSLRGSAGERLALRWRGAESGAGHGFGVSRQRPAGLSRQCVRCVRAHGALIARTCISSSPRRRGPSVVVERRWIPAFAGMTSV